MRGGSSSKGSSKVKTAAASKAKVTQWDLQQAAAVTAGLAAAPSRAPVATPKQAAPERRRTHKRHRSVDSDGEDSDRDSAQQQQLQHSQDSDHGSSDRGNLLLAANSVWDPGMWNGNAHTQIASAHHLGHFGMRTVQRWHSTSLPISVRSRWYPDVSCLAGQGWRRPPSKMLQVRPHKHVQPHRVALPSHQAAAGSTHQ